MIGLFNVAPNDQSVAYLGQIFGVMGSVLPAQGSVPLLLGAMFQAINTMFLVVGAMVVVYVTIVGVIKTASEGEFLGKQWDKTWIPIRTVFGIAALFPTGTGYSMIQVAIMWLIIQGVGAADTLWTTTLNYIQTAGSPTAGVVIPTADISNKMATLFNSLTCQASAHANYSNQYMNTNTQSPTQHSYYYCFDNASTDSFCSTSDAQLLNIGGNNQYNYSIGPSGTCGSLQYCNPAVNCNANDQLCITSCQAQQQALTQIVQVLGGIAQNFVQTDHEYMTFYSTPQNPANPTAITPWIQTYCNAKGVGQSDCCNTQFCTPTTPAFGMPSAPATGVACGSSAWQCGGAWCQTCSGASNLESINSTVSGTVTNFGDTSANAANNMYWPYAITPNVGGGDFINTNVNYYIGSIVQAINTYMQGQGGASPVLQGWIADAQKTGWALAGGYYYKMAQMSGSNLNTAIPLFNVTGVAGSGVSSWPTAPSLTDYRNNYDAANNLISNLLAKSQKSSNFGVSPPPQLAGLSSAIGSSQQDILNNFEHNLSSGGSQPIVQASQMGYGLLITAQVLFALVSIGAFLAGWLGNISVWVLGNGVQSGLGNGFLALFLFLAPAILALEAALFSIGATLAIYVPFIPYMIFTIGVIGWLIAVIEAIVAGPLIAIGIMAPGGQHQVWGRAEAAVMMIFNLILRPSLMVLGMMASMLLGTVVVNMINGGFGAVMTNIIPNPGLIELILFMAAYTMLIVTALNKCFSLIYHLPDKVLSYIGGHAAPYGEEQALGTIKGGVESGAGKVSGATEKQQQAADSAGQAYKKGEKAKTDAQTPTSATGSEASKEKKP